MKNVDYQLRQFVEVAKHKSLSEAAVTLKVTQSALSKQLREIELTVGHPVFRRHGRGIELTEQGDTLWRAAQTAYKLIDTTIGQIQTERKTVASDLRVARGLTRVVVNEFLANFLGQQTEIDVSMIEGSAEEVSKESGKVDIGFVNRPTPVSKTLKVTDVGRPGSTSACQHDQSGQTQMVVKDATPKQMKPRGEFWYGVADYKLSGTIGSETATKVGSSYSHTNQVDRNENAQEGSTASGNTHADEVFPSDVKNLVAITRSDDTRLRKYLRKRNNAVQAIAAIREAD